MILDCKLSLQDEVCSANGYWIYIHEIEEIKQQLGIDVPKSKLKPGDDVTQPQGAYNDDNDVTDPDITQVRGLRSPSYSPPELAAEPASSPIHPAESENQGNFPPVHARSQGANLVTHTAPESSHALSHFKSSPLVEVKGEENQELSTPWRAIAWVLVLISAFAVFALLKVLKR